MFSVNINIVFLPETFVRKYDSLAERFAFISAQLNHLIHFLNNANASYLLVQQLFQVFDSLTL